MYLFVSGDGFSVQTLVTPFWKQYSNSLKSTLLIYELMLTLVFPEKEVLEISVLRISDLLLAHSSGTGCSLGRLQEVK